MMGLNAGANVITINFTPETWRKKYGIYSKERFVVSANHAFDLIERAGLRARQPIASAARQPARTRAGEAVVRGPRPHAGTLLELPVLTELFDVQGVTGHEPTHEPCDMASLLAEPSLEN